MTDTTEELVAANSKSLGSFDIQSVSVPDSKMAITLEGIKVVFLCYYFMLLL